MRDSQPPSVRPPPDRKAITAAEAAALPIWAFSEEVDLASFSCREEDLAAFLRDDAARLHRERGARVYLVTHGIAVVGYIALSADVLILKTAEKKKLGFRNGDPSMPAIKIGRLAVDERYEHLGIGTRMMRLAFDIANTASDSIGCRLLTVDAMPSALSYYEKLGFEENKAVARRLDPKGQIYPDSTISMRFDLRRPDLPAWTQLGV